MPSSLHIVSTGMSKRSISRRSMAIAHGACTGVPNGLRMHTRQSPISSRKRSTTMVRSSGTTPVGLRLLRRGTAARCWRPGHRASSRPSAAPARSAGRARGSRAGTRRAPGRARADGRAGRRARTASCRARPGAGRDHDPLEGDVLDAPRGRAEQERLARPALVDHLLVELADPGAVGQEHAEQAAVGDGAAAGDGQPLATRRGPARCR